MSKKVNTNSQNSFNPQNSKSAMLWTATGVLLIALLFARAIYPELLWLTLLLVLPLLGAMGALVVLNQKALKSRTAAYGLNSVVTVVLVLLIVGVLNFLALRYPFKLDLTKNKVHSLSDQTIKLVKGLQKPVKATFYAKAGQRDQNRPLFDNFKGLNPKFEVEYVDPDREPTRAKQAGIKKYGTLHLALSGRESKIEEISEEKLTNALIKLTKEKTPMLCAITGHGEKSFTNPEADGLELARKALTDQSYEVKEITIVQENNKIPDSCDAITVLGPMKAFFAPEVEAIDAYLEKGGRAIVALDLNIKSGSEYTPELLPLLDKWYVKPERNLVVDPLSRMLGVDGSVAILANFAKDHAITKDAQGNAFFPFTRALEIKTAAPPSLHIQWLGQTTPKSWAVSDMTQLAKGEVHFTAGKDRNGPLNAAIALEGKLKDSQATKNTRLVVFGTSFFATNNYSRFGTNSDLFLNSISWVMEDESLISIRAKEEGPGKVELSQKAGIFILLLTVIAIPLLVAVGGLVIWIYRRRM